MKKILVFTAILLAHLTHAQLSSEQSNDENKKSHIQKGSWVVGGSFSIYNRNQENNYFNDDGDITHRKEKNNYYSISPQIGYTFSKNWLGGLSLRYSYNKGDIKGFNLDELDYKDENVNNTYTISPFVTRFFNLNKKLFLSLKGSFEYSITDYTSKRESATNLTNNYRYNDGQSFFIGLVPGITYFLNDKLAFQTTIGSFGYTNSKSDDLSHSNSIDDFNSYEYNSKSEGFQANLDLSSIYFGASYYF